MTALLMPLAIDHALSAFEGPVQRQARRTLRALLAARIADGDPAAWCGSRLTGDGFPVEFSFCTADARLRLALEPGAVDLTPRDRLEAAADLLDGWAKTPVPGHLLDALKRMQSTGPLRYGAWIGCRISDATTALKLYAEVPAGADIDDFEPPVSLLRGRAVVPRMIGYAPLADEVEVYLEMPSLLARELPAVLASAQLADQSVWLTALLEDSYGYAMRGRLPGPAVGLSHAGHGDRERLTLHFYARSLWGSDERIRRAFRRATRGCDWDEDRYAKVTAPLVGREHWHTFHGMFGIQMSRSLPPSFTIGVRPAAP
jgi:hypothetical protein